MSFLEQFSKTRFSEHVIFSGKGFLKISIQNT